MEERGERRKEMKIVSLVMVVGILFVLSPPAQCKEKHEVVSEMEFMANKTRLVGKSIALLTSMGDLMEVNGGEAPALGKVGIAYAVSAMTFRNMVKFTIPDTKENEKTLEIFYSLAPGTQGQRGTYITIYGKVVKVSDKEVYILVQREGGPAIEDGWPEDRQLCPNCGRPGAAKGPAKPPKKPHK